MLSGASRNRIEMVGNDRQRQTRQVGNIVCNMNSETRNAQKNAFYEGMKMYNSFNRLEIFKRVLKEYNWNAIQYF